MELRFDNGTLTLEGADQASRVPPSFVWDERVARWRAPALSYADILRWLVRTQTPYEDKARKYDEYAFTMRTPVQPRPYQQEAIAAWQQAKKRGVVVLPTGAGKTLVAQLAITLVNRSTLVVVPTLDLMTQWYDLLTSSLACQVGLIGGGSYEVGAVTITTYASAFRIMERMGDKFGLLIFDECHHLPGATFRYAAELAIAPFRLGLSATPGDDSLLTELIGPTVFRRDAKDLAGGYLADYRLERINVTLSTEEREHYEAERLIYRRFLDSQRINMAAPDGWRRFLAASARSEAGRRALLAYRESKRIALGTESKLQLLAELLKRHAGERTLLFTVDNETVYRLSERFLIPAITHETPVKERQRWLEAFSAGEVLALATSKVLNEGVNIPEASVAVVLSGSGSTREHIQRLGRILRPQPGKEAVLYELVASATAEERISERRKYADG